ncbi:uncharacterized protein [Amphiura filiformis]|uniref:uncharacterized protein n=1 Tax=Amphiura filiformis TaxID=82378 RepID=UPI003B225E7C
MFIAKMELLNIHVCIFLITLSFTVKCGSASADSFGQEFIFSYLTPHSRNGKPYLLIAAQSSRDVTNVNITVPGKGFKRSYVVTPNDILNATLPGSVYPLNREALKYNASILIHSDGEISVHGVYGFVHSGSGVQAAGFLVMPTSMLGKEYIIPTYPPHPAHFAEFAITALHTRTRVGIRVKAGEDIDLILQPYESYQIRKRLDLTGSIVVADQPVSVMSGVSCVQIPINYGNCEHITTHTPDVSSYGIQYVIGPFLYRRRGYVYRIITSQMETNLQINSEGGTPSYSQMDTGDFYEGDVDTLITITSDKPVMVVQFSKSRGTDSRGDPFMYIVSPITLFPSSVAFPVTVLPSRYAQQSYISVTILCDSSEALLLDAASPDWDDILISGSDPSFCIHRKALPSGLHNVTHFSDDARFSVIVYGFCAYSSYGYVAARNGHISRQNWQINEEVAEHKERGVSLHCGVTSMIAKIDPALVLDGRPSDVHLLDPFCFARLSGSYLEIETEYGSCGTLMEESSRGSIFRNRLLYNPPSSDVLRDSSLDIPIVCNVRSSLVLSVGAMVPEVGRIDTPVESSEDFGTNLTFKFQMFEDKTYNKAYVDNDYPINVDVKQELFFDVSVMSTNNDGNVLLSVKDIIASASLDVQEQPKYYFVDNGCKEDITVKFITTEQIQSSRFSLSAIAFKNFTKVYIHCRVFVCNASDTDNQCKKECFPRIRREGKRRSDRGFSEHKLQQGPLIIGDMAEVSQNRESSWVHIWISTGTLLIGVFIGSLVTILVWIIYKRRQRQPRLIPSHSIELIELSESSGF